MIVFFFFFGRKRGAPHPVYHIKDPKTGGSTPYNSTTNTEQNLRGYKEKVSQNAKGMGLRKHPVNLQKKGNYASETNSAMLL